MAIGVNCSSPLSGTVRPLALGGTLLVLLAATMMGADVSRADGNIDTAARPAFGLPADIPGPRSHRPSADLWQFSQGRHISTFHGHPSSRSASDWSLIVDTAYFEPSTLGGDLDLLNDLGWLADELYLNGCPSPPEANVSSKVGLGNLNEWGKVLIRVDGQPLEFEVLRDRCAWVAARMDFPRAIHMLGRSINVEDVKLISIADLSTYPTLGS